MKAETMAKRYTAKGIRNRIKIASRMIFKFDRQIARLKRAYKIRTGKEFNKYGRF